MKYFPLKTAVACLVMPPLLYVFILSGLGIYLNAAYDRKISNILIGNPAPALEGSAYIERMVSENISDFLSQDYLVKYGGVTISVDVATPDGQIIYPSLTVAAYQEAGRDRVGTPGQIAKHNYDILNQGIETRVEVRIDHGTPLPNLILLVLVGASLAVFLPVYRAAGSRIALDRAQDMTLVRRLREREKKDKKGLARLDKEKKSLFKRLARLESRYTEHRRKTKTNEEEMFEEIIQLEKERDAYADLKAEKDAEIEELQSRIQKIEKRKNNSGRRNEDDFLARRFAAVYKQVDMHRKAISGYLNLNEDQQIKVEEIIHQLDRNPEQVTIKRKVFSGKKHKTSVLEVLFSYNGRLYFHLLPNKRIQVLVIGTKKSQSRDMEFLHKL